MTDKTTEQANDAPIVWHLTAKEMAAQVSALLAPVSVNDKAWRSFYRSYAEKHGLPTPGSGGRYKYEFTTDQIIEWAACYRAHRKGNNAMTVSASPVQ